MDSKENIIYNCKRKIYKLKLHCQQQNDDIIYYLQDQFNQRMTNHEMKIQMESLNIKNEILIKNNQQLQDVVTQLKKKLHNKQNIVNSIIDSIKSISETVNENNVYGAILDIIYQRGIHRQQIQKYVEEINTKTDVMDSIVSIFQKEYSNIKINENNLPKIVSMHVSENKQMRMNCITNETIIHNIVRKVTPMVDVNRHEVNANNVLDIISSHVNRLNRLKWMVSENKKVIKKYTKKNKQLKQNIRDQSDELTKIQAICMDKTKQIEILNQTIQRNVKKIKQLQSHAFNAQNEAKNTAGLSYILLIVIAILIGYIWIGFKPSALLK